jgi:serine/threonine protein phosphatase PrpC
LVDDGEDDDDDDDDEDGDFEDEEEDDDEDDEDEDDDEDAEDEDYDGGDEGAEDYDGGDDDEGDEDYGLHALDMWGDNIEEGVGCTACVMLVRGSTLYVANAGDSRCVLARQATTGTSESSAPCGSESDLADGCSSPVSKHKVAGRVLERVVDLSVDHKPTTPLERKRIEAAGLTVSEGRVEGDLALSRAIGDTRYKQNHDLPPEEQAITALPDVRVFDLTKAGMLSDAFVLLACDGIWDCKTSEEAAAFAAERVERIVPVSPSCASEYGDWACAARTARSKCKGKGKERMPAPCYGGSGSESGQKEQDNKAANAGRSRLDATEVLVKLCDDCLSEDPIANDIGCDNISAVLVQLHMPKSAPTDKASGTTTTGQNANSNKRTAMQAVDAEDHCTAARVTAQSAGEGSDGKCRKRARQGE